MASCSKLGAQVLDALRKDVAAKGDYRSVWVTETHCLGWCHKDGATVVLQPKTQVFREVTLTDVPTLLALARNPDR